MLHKTDLKILRKLAREAELKSGVYRKGGAHGGTTRDKTRRRRKADRQTCHRWSA